MGLRPHVKALLDSIVQTSSEPIPDVLEMRRKQKERILPVEARTPVWRVEDKTIEVSGQGIPIRIYSSKAQNSSPLLMYFHGGGFCIGSLDSHDEICRRLANQLGWKVVAVDYRLAPEHPFPAGLQDCYAVTNWCYHNAVQLGVDRSKISVAGDSSGGTLATAVSMMARDRGTPLLQQQVLICPNTQFYQSGSGTPYKSYLDNGSRYLTTEQGISQFWSWYIANESDALHPYASPALAPNLSDLPSALVITAEYDPLRDEGEVYAHRLQHAGVETRLIRYQGTVHGFLSLFPDEEEGRQAYQAIRQFLTQA